MSSFWRKVRAGLLSTLVASGLTFGASQAFGYDVEHNGQLFYCAYDRPVDCYCDDGQTPGQINPNNGLCRCCLSYGE